MPSSVTKASQLPEVCGVFRGLLLRGEPEPEEEPRILDIGGYCILYEDD